jgi:hypothetical protein
MESRILIALMGGVAGISLPGCNGGFRAGEKALP